MRRPSFWPFQGTSVERAPLVGKPRKLPSDPRIRAAAAVVAVTALVTFIYYVFLYEEDNFNSPSSSEALSLKELASQTASLDLAQCSIPKVEASSGSASLADYKLPKCPDFNATKRILVSKDDLDEVRMFRNAVQFVIRPMITATTATPERPSVAVLFLDAVSRASFFRNFVSTGADLQAKMERGEAFTFGGLASSDRYTPPNAAMVLAGIACSDGVLSGFVYQSFCEAVARNAPGDVTLWEIARRQGMITSAAIDDWQDMAFMHRGNWDHEFEAAKSVPAASVDEYPTDYGRLRCFGGEEVSGAQLKHTRAVHEAYDHTGARIFSLTYLNSMHQPDTRHGRVVDDHLRDTLAAFSRLQTPTTVLIFADHGSQYALQDDQMTERYLPLGVFLPPRGAPPAWADNLRSNQFAVTSMADLHSTLLHRIDPDAQPLHTRWPYKAMLMWPVAAADLATTTVSTRPVSALGIQRRHHPCASPWIHVNSSELTEEDLSGAASYLAQQVNELGGSSRLGGPCRPVRLLGLSREGGKLYTREPFELKLSFDVETVPVPGLPQHNATYFGSIHRFWGFCRGYMKSACLFGGIFPWRLDDLEPTSVYAQYEGCMGDIKNTPRKRFCICD